jgi:hypothetical protein
MANFVDQNGVGCFVDQNGATCFVDQNGNLLCCQATPPPIGSRGGKHKSGGAIYRIVNPS